MALFPRSLLLVKSLCPAVGSDGVAGILVKGLAAEFRTAMTHVNDFALAALLFDRGDPIELLSLLGAFKALAVGPKGHQKPWCHRWTRGRKAAEDGRVRMRRG